MSEVTLPRYHRIFLQLRDQIAQGELQPGDRLPGEEELAALFGVSRITSKRALNELQRAGFVSREQGRGTTVKAIPLDTSAFDGTLESLEASNKAIGQTAIRLMDFVEVPPPPAVCKALRLNPSERAFRIRRVRSNGGQPFCYVTAFVPPSIGRTVSAKELETTMLVDLIERSGAKIDHADQIVSATAADEQTAQLLSVPSGAALLRVVRTSFSADDSPVEHFTALFRPDLYRISMKLSRRSGRAKTGRKGESVFEIMSH
jgi:GntR family transcriptional regulator